ncbi:Rieske (2Fe-2S) protein [Streptomyces sp. NPDC057702]|uniref:Rieske (2Fe-2S) protein n=1 Tax=unclassified Streptomyces TaxID=2593676 RepID=UPI00367D75FB
MARPTRARPQATRRTVVAAVGVAGLAAVLAACGDDKGDGSEGGSAAPRTLGKASEIPRGGGVIFKKAKVVVTQPTAGTYKAFTSICTHNGCPVASVANGTINCDCHGSKFDITDGSVKAGPARRPLKAKKVTVSADTLTLH